METVTELPANPVPQKLLPHAFTKENAAENARKAVISRERFRQGLSRLSEPKRARLVSEQIVRTRKVLNQDDLEPRERAQLLCALDKLLDRERILLSVPLPGSRRPGRESSKDKPQSFEPSE